MANEMVKSGQSELAAWNNEQLRVMKQTLCQDLTNDEFLLFVEVARARRLNPFARQIYAVKRGGKVMHQTAIDGFRVIAERSGKYAGQVGPWWCGDDGAWTDVWLSSKPPTAARVGVLRMDFKEPIFSVARFAAYRQESNSLWSKMGDNQIAKCAEALALRRAFPEELSGLYTSDEMEQAGPTVQTITATGETVAHAVPTSPTDPKPADPVMDEMAEALAVAYDKRISQLGSYEAAVKLAAEMNADARLPKLMMQQLLGHCRTMARQLKETVSGPERVGDVSR